MSDPEPRLIEEIFARASGRPTEAQRTLLEKLCAGDAALRAEVEALLAAERRSTGFLERSAWGEELEPARPAREIGPYRLLRKLGEGGMGTVYLAARSDAEYRQPVALKVVRPAMLAGAERRGRLRVERQILAALDHSNIARLVDGGTTREGIPYLVMEYVDGEPIDRYCERAELSLDECLELFRKVCAAVHHAHRHLVVHRDLKPSNVLVTCTGEPKLLDFGIAKLLRPDPGSGELPETGPWIRLLTPAYASPEQLRGERITIGSDVYSLGVLLRELLSRFPGTKDLDLIATEACQEDPEERYPSAWALAEDLDRFRAGLPVNARRGTVIYRATKFLRRHRWGVAVTAALLVLILGAAMTIAHQSARIARERDRFRAERDAKTQVLEFVQGMLQASDPKQAAQEDLSVREVLDQGVLEVEKLEGQPLLRATLLDTLGNLHGSWGSYEKAEEMIREGLELRRRLAGETSLEVAESLASLGSIRWLRGDFEAATRHLRKALATQERRLGPEHIDVAQSMSNLAVALRDLERHEEAEKLDRRALAMRRRLLGEDHPAVVESLGNLVGALLYKGDLAAAEELSLQVIELRRRLYRPDHPYLAVALNNHAGILRDQGRYREAEDYYRQALRAWEESLGADHHHVATARANLAKLLARQERDQEAEELFRRARQIYVQSLGARHWRVADCRLGLAAIELRRQRPAAAEEEAREARAIYRESLSPDNLRVALAESLWGEILLRLGRAEEAGPLLENSYEQIRREMGEESFQSRRAKARLEALEAL